jgi:hypothetical protein
MKKITLFLFVSLSIMFACGDDEPVAEIPEEDLGKLYLSTFSQRFIGVIDPTDPGEATELYDFFADGLNPVMAIRIDHDAQMLYSTEMENDRIVRMKADGTGTIQVVYDNDDGIGSPQGMAIDPITGKIYWANEVTKQIMRGSMDGTEEPQPMYDGEDFEYDCHGMWVDHDNGLLYFADENWARIWVGKLDGTGEPVLLIPTIEGFYCTASIQVVDDKIYWTDHCTDVVMRASLTGALNITTLYSKVDGVDGPFGLYVDKENDRIYWTETVDNVVAYGNLDGTAEPVVIDELVNSYGLDLDKANP